MRAVDAGPITLAHQLESMGYLHIALQQTLGTHYASTMKVLA